MTTRETLHRLIDQLPECDLDMVGMLIEWRHRLRDEPLLLNFATAPLDDEPWTEEDEAALAEARADIARGNVVSLDEVRQELGCGRVSPRMRVGRRSPAP